MSYSKIMPVVMLASAIGANAQQQGTPDRFSEEGTVWVTYIDPFPYAEPYLEDYATSSVGEIEGKQAMKITPSNEAEAEAYVCSEGSKVYALFKNNEWFLIYDFGLKEGEGTTITHYYRGINPKNEPYTEYVVCTGISDDDNNPGITVMSLRVYESEEAYKSSAEDYIYDGEWLAGIGSLAGPLHNLGWRDPGSCSSLWEVKADGNVIYKSKTAGVSELHDSAGISAADTLYDLSGRRISRNNGISQKDLPSGIYIIRSDRGDTKKILVP